MAIIFVSYYQVVSFAEMRSGIIKRQCRGLFGRISAASMPPADKLHDVWNNRRGCSFKTWT